VKIEKYAYYVTDEDRVILYDEKGNEIGFFVIDDLIEKARVKS